MAAALSTTLRAALPVRPAARSERSASTVVKRSSAVSTDDAQRLEQPPQRLGLVEGGPGGRAGLTREAQREPDDDRRRLHLAHGVDDGAAVARGVTAALDRPPRAGQRAAAVAVGHADAPGPRSSAATRPGPPPGSVAAHADRSRCASASAASICEGSFPPASATSAEPPPPPPTMAPSVRTSCVASGEPPVAAAMATLAPSGEPPSTTARTPSWRSTAWASARSASGSTSSRRATTTPPSAAADSASVRASASLDCWRSPASSFSASRWRSHDAPDGGQQLVGLGAQQLGGRLHQALALEGPLERRVPGQRRRSAGCWSRWSPPRAG